MYQWEEEEDTNAASHIRSGLYLSTMGYRRGGPFLRVEVRVGAQPNFIIGLDATRNRGKLFQVKRVRMLYAVPVPLGRSTVSHMPRDLRHSRSRTAHGCTHAHSLTDDELTLHPRCAAVKLYTSRPRAYAWRRNFCLIARSLSPPYTWPPRHSSLRHTVSGQGRYLLRSRE